MNAINKCNGWRENFIGLDAVHHQAGQYLTTVRDNEPDIFGYPAARHFKAAATRGNTFSFVGS